VDVDRDRDRLGTRVARRLLALFQHSSPDVVAFVLAFAAGAILTMLADTMMPEAYQHAGKWVGVLTTLGFAVAFTIHVLD
jgi:zinc transporter, ZIP family